MRLACHILAARRPNYRTAAASENTNSVNVIWTSHIENQRTGSGALQSSIAMDSARNVRLNENELLISFLQSQPIIRDQRASAYRNAEARWASWIFVAKGMCMAGSDGAYTARRRSQLVFCVPLTGEMLLLQSQMHLRKGSAYVVTLGVRLYKLYD